MRSADFKCTVRQNGRLLGECTTNIGINDGNLYGLKLHLSTFLSDRFPSLGNNPYEKMTDFKVNPEDNDDSIDDNTKIEDLIDNNINNFFLKTKDFTVQIEILNLSFKDIPLLISEETKVFLEQQEVLDRLQDENNDQYLQQAINSSLVGHNPALNNNSVPFASSNRAKAIGAVILCATALGCILLLKYKFGKPTNIIIKDDIVSHHLEGMNFKVSALTRDISTVTTAINFI